MVKPRTVGEQLRETVQLKANLTMAEARELAEKVATLKLTELQPSPQPQPRPQP